DGVFADGENRHREREARLEGGAGTNVQRVDSVREERVLAEEHLTQPVLDDEPGNGTGQRLQRPATDPDRDDIAASNDLDGAFDSVDQLHLEDSRTPLAERTAP